MSLDDPGAAASVRADPVEAIARLDALAIIDEVQRAPELLLAIKQKVRSTVPVGRQAIAPMLAKRDI